MKKKLLLSTLFILFILTVLPSLQVYAQSSQIATLALGENESVYTVYSDYQGKNFAAIILKNVEGLVSSYNEYYILTKDNKYGPYSFVKEVIFADNGNTMIASVSKDDQWYILVNSQLNGPYSKVGRIVSIVDQKRYAFSFIENNSLYLLTEQKKIGPFSTLGSLVANQKTKKIVFCATNSSNVSQLYVNGEVVDQANKIIIFGFYTEKNLLAYAVNRSSGYSLVVGSTTYGPYDNISLDIAVKDEKNVLFYALIQQKWYLIAGKEKAGPFDETGFVCFSPDYKQVLYASEKDGSWKVYLGSKPLNTLSFYNFAFIDFVLMPDGTYSPIYLAKNEGRWAIFIGASETPAISYDLDTDDPYIGLLNITYYGEDLRVSNDGTIAYLFYSYDKAGFSIGLACVNKDKIANFGNEESYDTTYVLDVSNGFVYMVINGQPVVGCITENNDEKASNGTILIGSFVYGLDGKAVALVVYDRTSNTVSFLKIEEAYSIILSMTNATSTITQ